MNSKRCDFPLFLRSPLGGRYITYACVFIFMVSASVALYSAALKYELSLFDSWKYVAENRCIHNISIENIVCLFSQPYFSNWQPVTLLSYMLEFQFFSVDGYGYHATNMVLHGVNSFLVFVLIIFFVGGEKNLFKMTPSAYLLGASFLASLVFLIHPQHVESVVWVAERKGLLAFLFLSLSLLSYCQIKSCDGGLAAKVLFVVFYLLAILSKATAVTFPVFLVLLDRFYFDKTLLMQRGVGYEIEVVFRSLRGKAVFIFCSLAVVYVNYLAQGDTVIPVDQIGVMQRMLNIFHNSFFYLNKFILPENLHSYYMAPDAIVNQDVFIFIFYSVLFVSVSLAVVVVAIKWSASPLLIWSSYLVLSVTTIGIMQVGSQIAADRYAYLTTAPFYFLFAKLVIRMLQWRARVVLPVLLSLMVILSIKSRTQILLWKDELTMWTNVIEKSPNGKNVRGEYALGEVYSMLGDTDSALKHFRRGVGYTEWVIFDSYISFVKLLITQELLWEAEGRLLAYIYSNHSTPEEIKSCWALLEGVYKSLGDEESAKRVKALIDVRLADLKEREK